MTVIVSFLQGQKDINVFAAACKALATVSAGKAAAKRAGKALEKVSKQLLYITFQWDSHALCYAFVVNEH